MSADYTTVGLLRNLKRRGFIPAGSGLTTSELLEVASEQLRNYIPAFLKGIREEFIISELSFTIPATGIVPVPVRAVGAALRSVEWVRSDGTRKPLNRIEPERAGGYPLTSSEPFGYRFLANNLIMVPYAPGTLILSYQQRPGQLVLPTSCGLATGVSGSDINATGLFPDTMVAGTLVDLVSATPNFDLIGADLEIASVSLGTVTLVDPVPAAFAVGDYVCLATETPIPQLPLEVQDLLAQASALAIAHATGSTRTATIEAELKTLREQVTMILTPRSDGSARPVISKSRLGRWR